MLRTKCILAPRAPEDGMRISVMSRHTLSDGVTPDARITSETFAVHWPVLAPPPRLIGDYRKRGLSWDNFSRRFGEHLESLVAQAAVLRLLCLLEETDITLLCIEDSPDCCHRRLLAEKCRQLQPGLQMEIG